MRPVSAVAAGLLLALCACSGYSQSLAELAKKEKDRRAAVTTETKVINNEKAAQSIGTPAGAQQPGTTPAKPSGEPETKSAAAAEPEKHNAGTDEPVDFQGRPESFWRQTFGEARKRVADLENQTNVIILKLNDLHNQFYRESDGYKQQAIQREIQKTIYEQDVTKVSLEKARVDLVDLEREARKSGALPGWLRDK